MSGIGETCGDDRFELIAKAKAKLLDATNIEGNQTDMAALDSILFRCWQMGWLDQLRENRWRELFGTPERAARTLARMCAISDGSCAGCPMYKANLEHCKSEYTHLKSIVEWLRGDA